jgi:hypothetical protein
MQVECTKCGQTFANNPEVIKWHQKIHESLGDIPSENKPLPKQGQKTPSELRQMIYIWLAQEFDIHLTAQQHEFLKKVLEQFETKPNENV